MKFVTGWYIKLCITNFTLVHICSPKLVLYTKLIWIFTKFIRGTSHLKKKYVHHLKSLDEINILVIW